MAPVMVMSRPSSSWGKELLNARWAMKAAQQKPSRRPVVSIRGRPRKNRQATAASMQALNVVASGNADWIWTKQAPAANARMALRMRKMTSVI